MSIISAGHGKTYKNYREDEHPNLLHCPFQDECDNLLKHHMSNHKEFLCKQHLLILFNKKRLVDKQMVPLHDPMKRVKLLCDGCVKPIMTVPFYMCCQYVDEQCCFVLHEWCAKLPFEIQDYASHPGHTLYLLPKIPSMFFDVFKCEVCELPSNGFAYGCKTCEYYIDINCAFILEEITHDAHPDHLLLKGRLSGKKCKACMFYMYRKWGFQCSFCDFYIHVKCAFLLPKVVKHKCDKHHLSLRHEPAENYTGEYFCEICEEQFSPWSWFYHCIICAQSMHTACVPLILQYEQAYTFENYFKTGVTTSNLEGLLRSNNTLTV